MTDAITIYAPTISTFARIVAIVAEEKGIKWLIEPTVTRSEEQRQRHPFRRAPAVDFHNEKLFETDAITRYIDEAYDGPPLQPDNPRARAEMQKWMSVMQHYLFPAIEIGLVGPRLLAPANGQETDERMIERALPTIKYQLSIVDAQLSANAYFAGNQISLADFYMQVVWWTTYLTPEGKSLIDQCDNLKRWLTFMMHRPSAQATAWPSEDEAITTLEFGS